ncbi:helix-turn-helix transcriptional regulator [Nocardioides sp. Leaf307]|uniref:helix-turn-helix transcriptional regulator n=1 Tax=Nocardioides sp. Leaf307 TaxID=1736331 RepID=UPI0009E96ED2|nr:response regulator transcription factor [Nocardioides sp. Leaf307]
MASLAPETQVKPVLLVPVALPPLLRIGLDSVVRRHACRVALAPAVSPRPPDVAIFEPSSLDDRAADAVLSCPSIALSFDTSPWGLRRAHSLGADEVLPVSVDPAELVAAVERLARRRDEPAAGGSDPAPLPGALSGREHEIVCLICDGLSNAEISQRLYLSINSVKTYIRSAYLKMGVTSRSQAVLWGVEHGCSRLSD